MVCPSCGQHECVRLHRRGVLDRAMKLVALKPWRCMRCRQRFYAWKVARAMMRYAHCPECGTFEVQQHEESSAVQGFAATILKILRASTFRCDACGLNFHSFGVPYEAAADDLARE